MEAERKFATMSKELDRLDDVHDCDLGGHTARVVGGDPVKGPGVSAWCCATCLPLKMEIIGRAFDDVRSEVRS